MDVVVLLPDAVRKRSGCGGVVHPVVAGEGERERYDV